MRAHINTLAQRGQQPCLGAGGIRQRLLRGEGLRSDDEQRRRRIVRRERAREVLRIDIGDERDVDTLRLRARAAARPRRARERRADEKRSEIGPADAEIDDGAEGSSCRAHAHAAADLCGQRAHSRLRRADVGNDVPARHDKWRIARLAQRRMERRLTLRLVDFFSREQRADPSREPGLDGVSDEQRQGIGSEALLRQVDEPGIPRERQAIEAGGVAREELGECRAGKRTALFREIGGNGGGHRFVGGPREAPGPAVAIPA